MAENPGDDMTSYITNPTFTDNADGWTITGDARYFNGKGFDGTTNFIELTNWGSSWDATISQTVTGLPNGYFLVQAAGQMSGVTDMWMKLVANGIENQFSRNGDTNGNILADGTETTYGSGVAGWRYTRVIAKVTDGTLAISCVGHSNTNARWANFDAVTLKYLGTILPDGTDVTPYIVNNSFETRDLTGWTKSGTSSDTQVCTPDGNHATNGADGNYIFNTWWQGVALTQTIANLPNGLYTLKASLAGSDEGADAKLFLLANDGHSNVITITRGTQGQFNDYTYDFSVETGNTKIGAVGGNDDGSYNANGHWWYKADNFRLIYRGARLSDGAIKLPDGGEMTAGTWYYFDITVAGDNYNATATTLGDIICTNDGTQLMSEATGGITLTAEDNSFVVGRYYVKSSADNTLEVDAASYTYTVGSPTLSVADGAYTNNSLSTFTFTFSDATSNDPDATFAILNGSAIASLKKGGVEQAQGTLSLDGTILTATFSDVALDLSSTYTIEIAAGVVGYAGQVTNAAISTTIKTGIIADGNYFIKKYNEDKYLTRGGYYGTETVTDNIGIILQATIQSDGTYALKNIEHSLSANTNKYLGEYTDANDVFAWTFEASTNGYYMKNTAGNYLTTKKYDYTDDQGNTNSYYYKSFTSNSAEAIEWNLLTKSEYAAALSARKNAEIVDIATAASMSATTLTAFETELGSNWGATDMTGNITNATVKSNLDGWMTVHYAANAQATPGADGNCAEVWNGQGGVKQTISSLPAGIYKVTVSATWRPGNKDAAERVADNANTTAWIYANDNYTQLVSWYDGGATINNRAGLVSSADKYLNTVYVYLDGTEDLTIGIAAPNFCVQPWMPFYNWTLTYYEAKATAEEKDALSNAISDAEAKTLGFEANEYAPYNNVAALEALADAKAVDPDAASGAAVVTATTTLIGATWTENSAEVNAVLWKTDYTAEDKASDNYIHPLGWTNTGYNTRILNSEVSTDAALSTIGTAIMMKYNTTYGEKEGYTMPLKAGKIYKITFKFCGWGNNPTTNIVMTDPDGDDISLAPGFKPATNDGNSNAENWYDYTGYFVSKKAGDYVLKFNKVEDGQQQIGLTNVQIFSATEIEFADGSVPTYAPGTYPTVKISRKLTAERWATAVYPFALSNNNVNDIAVLDSYTASNGELKFKSASSSEANVPFLMRSTNGTDEITLSNVDVAAAAVTDAKAAEVSLKGTYSQITIDNSAKNYVLSNNGIYEVGPDNNATINPYRAYFQVAQDAEARSLTFVVDGKATAIKGIDTDKQMGNGNVYDLKGQKVSGQLKKGVYVVDGKKVAIK